MLQMLLRSSQIWNLQQHVGKVRMRIGVGGAQLQALLYRRHPCFGVTLLKFEHPQEVPCLGQVGVDLYDSLVKGASRFKTIIAVEIQRHR